MNIIIFVKTFVFVGTKGFLELKKKKNSVSVHHSSEILKFFQTFQYLYLIKDAYLKIYV